MNWCEWELKHYWDDGVTIECRYFSTKKEAEEFARKAIAILPDSPEVKQTLADALKKAP